MKPIYLRKIMLAGLILMLGIVLATSVYAEDCSCSCTGGTVIVTKPDNESCVTFCDSVCHYSTGVCECCCQDGYSGTIPIWGSGTCDTSCASLCGSGYYGGTHGNAVACPTNCVYSISPTNQTFTSQGGAGIINVSANTGCSWNSAANVSWITLSSTSGSGPGIVAFSVNQNPVSTIRTGLIYVADQTFTVTQDAGISTDPFVWQGGFTGYETDWAAPQNWMRGGTVTNMSPDANSKVEIPGGCSYYPVINGIVTVSEILIKSGASLFIESLSGTVLSSLSIIKSGTLIVEGSASLTLSNSALYIDDGGNVEINKDGTLDIQNSDITANNVSGAAPVLLNIYGTLNISGTDTDHATFRSIFVNNQMAGRIRWLGGHINMENNSSIKNTAGSLFSIQSSNCALNDDDTATFENQGTVEVNSTLGAFIGIKNMKFGGELLVSSGRLSIGDETTQCEYLSNAVVKINSGSDLEFKSGEYFLYAGNITGTGTLNFGTPDGGPSVRLYAPLMIDTGFTVENVNLEGSFDIKLNGLFSWTGGTFHGGLDATTGIINKLILNHGGIIGSPAYKKLYGRILSVANSSIATMNGPVNLDLGNSAGFYIETGAFLHIKGDAVFYSFDDMPNQVKNAGVINGEGKLAFLAGTNATQPPVFVNHGGIAPGNMAPGRLEIQTPVYDNSSGILKIDIDKPGTAGVDYDQLLISGNAVLGGTLSVNLKNIPSTAADFEILSTSGLSGEFTVSNLPAVPGFHWETKYSSTSVILSLVQSACSTQISIKPAGAGEISGPGVTCTTDKTVCTGSFPLSGLITLSPTPEPGYRFLRWEFEDGSVVSEPSLSYDPAACKTLTAVFEPFEEKYHLSVMVSGSGSVSASGLSCSQNYCEGDYAPQSSLFIAASPLPGFEVEYWNLDQTIYHGGNSLTIVMDTYRHLSVSFKQSETPYDECPDDPDKIYAGVCGCGVPDIDTDGDTVFDCNDACPKDPNKTEPGICGCGTSDKDTDSDNTPDCKDKCPNDPHKIELGICGCGILDTDSDSDNTPDCKDKCPNDPHKIEPGICGCGIADTDRDEDGVPDCNDGCPDDPHKTEPGDFGCGIADTDTDGDGTPDCYDLCPNDPNKTEPGICGCGVPESTCLDLCPNDPNKTEPGICGCGILDTDSDSDNTPDCNDECVNDPNKIKPGICGCGVLDTDTDSDNTPDCKDECVNDPNKIKPGICGCGVLDTDTDGDKTPDCKDGCPDDPNKTEPGICGCGVPDKDSDNDNTPDCKDKCPNDPNKTEPGICGCGIADTGDSDNDGTLNCKDKCPNDPKKIEPGICGCGVPEGQCSDECPDDPNKTEPGQCGCGVSDTDTDSDGTADCNDICHSDPNKTEPGICGCGISDADMNGDGLPDCESNQPPYPPTAVSPLDGAIITTASVTLKTSAFQDPEGDSHFSTQWRIRSASGSYNDSNAIDYTANSGVNLTEYTLSDLADGVKYFWMAGYSDSGSGKISWSAEYSFTVGTVVIDRSLRVDPGTTRADYRMKSIVHWQADSSAEQVFGKAIGEYDTYNFKIGAYDPLIGGYIEYGNGLFIEPGRAFWVLARNGLDITVQGVQVSTNHPFRISLLYNSATGNGWNMIAPPIGVNYLWANVEVSVYDNAGNAVFEPTPVSKLSSNNGYIDSRLWRWSAGQYFDDTQIMEKNSGFWVRAYRENVVLIFNPASYLTDVELIEKEKGQWAVGSGQKEKGQWAERKWAVGSGQKDSGQLSVVSGQKEKGQWSERKRSVVSGQKEKGQWSERKWSVGSGQWSERKWSVGSGQWSIFPEHRKAFADSSTSDSPPMPPAAIDTTVSSTDGGGCFIQEAISSF